MAIDVALQNPFTGETTRVKVGWSWVLFLFSGAFGIPLFRRKLQTWGFVFLAINLVAMVCQIAIDNAAAQLLLILVQLLAIGLIIFMGVKGNEITAKNYLAQGWTFVDPNSEITRYAKMRWHIFDQPDMQRAPPVREVRW